jgi:hypothetical protein
VSVRDAHGRGCLEIDYDSDAVDDDNDNDGDANGDGDGGGKITAGDGTGGSVRASALHRARRARMFALASRPPSGADAVAFTGTLMYNAMHITPFRVAPERVHKAHFRSFYEQEPLMQCNTLTIIIYAN